MKLISISGAMAKTSFRITSFRASKVCPVFQNLIFKGKTFTYQDHSPVDQAQKEAKCTLWCYRWTCIINLIINKRRNLFYQTQHCVHRKRQVYCWLKALLIPLNVLIIYSYDPSKVRCSFCRIPYIFWLTRIYTPYDSASEFLPIV